MITHAELLERLHYDPLTGLFTWLVSSRPGWVGKIAGSQHSQGYWHIRIRGHLYLAHQSYPQPP
ncbi:Pathogenesis-related transcriptional factor and ERF protein (fragment) [Mesorhizobium sp. STM 4661]